MLLGACGATAPKRSGGRVTLAAPEPGDARYAIARADLDRILQAGASEFIQHVQVEPVVTSGRFQGFRLVSLYYGDPDFEQTAVRPGDIIQRINGCPIERPEQFMAVWDSLAEADHLSVQLVRGGESLLVTWQIR